MKRWADIRRKRLVARVRWSDDEWARYLDREIALAKENIATGRRLHAGFSSLDALHSRRVLFAAVQR